MAVHTFGLIPERTDSLADPDVAVQELSRIYFRDEIIKFLLISVKWRFSDQVVPLFFNII